VLVFAGALLAEALSSDNAPLDYLIRAARYDFIKALPFATVRYTDLGRHRLQISSEDDRCP